MDQPLLSIIIPTFNSSGGIREVLESILNQRYKNFEIVLVDGASTDQTIEIIREYQQKFNSIHFISEKDQGIYDAMNKGARLAKGEWLYFIGSDDRLYDEGVLSSFAGKAAADQTSEMIYGKVLMREGNEVYGGKFSYHRLILKNICHQAIFLKKSTFEQFGPFNIEYKVLADHDLNLKLFRHGIKARYMNRFIAVFGAGGFSSTYYDTLFVDRFEEIYSDYVKNPLNRARLKLDMMLGVHKKSGK